MWPFRRRKQSADTGAERPVDDSDSVFDRIRDGLADAFESGDGKVSAIRVASSTHFEVNGEEYDPNNPLHVALTQHLESVTGRDLDGDGEVTRQPAASRSVFIPKTETPPHRRLRTTGLRPIPLATTRSTASRRWNASRRCMRRERSPGGSSRPRRHGCSRATEPSFGAVRRSRPALDRIAIACMMRRQWGNRCTN
jgi:hypothetical protein